MTDNQPTDPFTTARAEVAALSIARSKQLGTDSRERLIRQDALKILDRLEAAVKAKASETEDYIREAKDND